MAKLGIRNKNMRILSLRNTKGFVSEIGSFSKLNTLDLTDSNIIQYENQENPFMYIKCSLKQWVGSCATTLTNLFLNGHKVNDQELEEIAESLQKLKSISLTGCNGITNSGLSYCLSKWKT